MKKSLKKLSLNKKSILTLDQAQSVKGAGRTQTCCCVATCGGYKSNDFCKPKEVAAD